MGSFIFNPHPLPPLKTLPPSKRNDMRIDLEYGFSLFPLHNFPQLPLLILVSVSCRSGSSFFQFSLLFALSRPRQPAPLPPNPRGTLVKEEALFMAPERHFPPFCSPSATPIEGILVFLLLSFFIFLLPSHLLFFPPPEAFLG